MDKADSTALQTTLTLRMEGLTAGDSIMIEFSRLLPSAQIYFPSSAPALWMYVQMPGDPIVLQYAELQPRRLELQLAAAPEVLTIALAVTCGQPFLYGWLHVPRTVRTTLSTHVEALQLMGSSYWALPMEVPGQGHSTNPLHDVAGQQKES